MAHVALTILVAVHGAIHVLGFLKWSGLAPVPQLSGRTLVPLSHAGARAFALLWLAASVLLLLAAAFRVLRHDAWWVPALAGALLSQALVVLAWHAAKAGSIANAVILLAAVIGAAHARFEHRTGADIRAILAQASAAPSGIVDQASLQQAPPPVRFWLERAGVVGRERTRTVRLRQRGDLRTSPKSRWMHAEAEQYFSVQPPAFVWRVDTSMMGLPIAGRDEYAGGRGRMLIQAASLVSLVDDAGDEIDQGALLRFLGETVWFPSAVLSPYVTWEAVGPTSAKATMRHAGVSASAVFTFSADGRVLGMSAERFMGGGPDAKRVPWVVSCTEWRAFAGVEVPTRGDVTWKLEGGDFTYYRWEILDVELNPAES